MTLQTNNEQEQAPLEPNVILDEPLEVKRGWLSKIIESPMASYAAVAVIVVSCLVAVYSQSNGAISERIPGLSSFGSAKIVTFDPVKFLNAQRAAASILASNPSADLALTITQVARQAEDVIREEAKGATVIVKQAVVLAEDHPDITDKVLNRFGLPTEVPSISTPVVDSESLENLAPSNTAFGRAQKAEDLRERFKGEERSINSELELLDKQLNLIP